MVPTGEWVWVSHLIHSPQMTDLQAAATSTRLPPPLGSKRAFLNVIFRIGTAARARC
jgi:hypothetical protein